MPKLKAVVAGMCDGLHNRVLMKTSGGVAASGQRTRTAALPRSDEANSGYGWEFRKQLCEGKITKDYTSCRSTSLDRVAREYRILPMTFGSKSSLIVPLLIPQFLPCSVSFVLLCINYGLLSSLRYKWAELLTLKSFLDSKSSPSLSLVCTN
ncbi:hypothetical protein ACET3Z_017993 [Daucus carota]